MRNEGLSSESVDCRNRGLKRASTFNGKKGKSARRHIPGQKIVVAVVILLVAAGPNLVTCQTADFSGGIDGITKFNVPAAAVGVSIKNREEAAFGEKLQHIRTRHQEEDSSSSAGAVIVLVCMGVMYATLIIVGAMEASRMDAEDNNSTATAKTIRTCSSGDTEYEQVSSADHDEVNPVGRKYQQPESYTTTEATDKESSSGEVDGESNTATPQAGTDESLSDHKREDEEPHDEQSQAFLNSNRKRALTDVHVRVPAERKPSIVVRKLRGAKEDYYCYEFGDTDSDTTEEDEKSCITVVLDQDQPEDDEMVFFDDDPIFHIIL